VEFRDICDLFYLHLIYSM